MQQHLLTSHIHEFNKPAMGAYFNCWLITQHNSYDVQSATIGNTTYHCNGIADSL